MEQVNRNSAGLTSTYRGVTWSKKSQKWQVALNMAGTHVHLGTYLIQEEAAVVFDRAALVVRADKAKLNFPASNYHDEQGNLIYDEYVNAKIEAAKEPGGPSGRLGKRKLITMGDDAEGEDDPSGRQRIPFNSRSQPRTIVRPSTYVGRKVQFEKALWARLSALSSLVPKGGKVLGIYPDMTSRKTVGVLYSSEGQEGQEGPGVVQYVALICSDARVVEHSQPFSDESQARIYIKEKHEALHLQAQQAAADAAALAAAQMMQMAIPTQQEGEGVLDPNFLASAMGAVDMATLTLALEGMGA